MSSGVFAPGLGRADEEEAWGPDEGYGPDLVGEDGNHEDGDHEHGDHEHELGEGFDAAFHEALAAEPHPWAAEQEAGVAEGGSWPDREDWAPDPEGYGPELAGDEPEQEDLDPEDLDPEDLEPEDLDPEDLDPEDLEPEDLDPEDLDPEDREPEGLDPADLTPEDLEPGSAAAWGEDLQFEAEEYARHALYEALDAGGPGAAEDEVRPVPRGTRPPIRTTAQLRAAWSAYACAEATMVPLRLLGWTTPVNPATVDAWRALEAALVRAGYRAHRAWVFNCRTIAGQTTRSLHAYGLAVDIDHAGPTCNVNRPTPDGRAVRFSRASTKEERCADVARGVADTAFTPCQVAAVEAIRTVDGHQVFAWGGRWRTTKDTMHFQINVTPEELARGLRGGTPTAPRVVGPTAPVPRAPAAEVRDPRPSDYADLARRILRRRKRSVGVVLSVVQLVPNGAVVDTRTERSGRRHRLVNPPAHVVLPAEVYEITFRRTTLRYVWILSNEKATFPVGGILFLPLEGSTVVHLVTFNVGALDGGACTNVHHAEMQATRWVQEQPPAARALIGGISVWNLSRKTGLGYSPCNPCCVDLARFLTDLRAVRTRVADITWLTPYDRNARCGHPTDEANIARLVAAHWTVHRPPPSRRASGANP